MNKSVMMLFFVVLLVFFFAECASLESGYDNESYNPPTNGYPPYDLGNMDEFDKIVERDFVLADQTPDSYFSLNINTASYSIIRRSINSNVKIYKDQVVIEEMLNYFKFNYPQSENGKILSISGSFIPCPWNGNSQLLSIGIKTDEIQMSNIDNNLVFLIDVFGSMDSPDRLPLVQQAFILLTEQLNPNDRVSIVTYASGVSVRLDGATGDEIRRICGIIEDLSAGGSTSGAGGIQKAYELATKYFKADGNNRVILATDGDFNVGISSQKELEEFISTKRKTGVYLSVLGFGMGNLKNNKMETLANCGNGNFAYIDTINEARKVFIEEAGGTLKTVAKDAKAMVRFNPDYVDKYRQIGYENRQLSVDDWENVEKDAGELGAGRCITAVYEVILKNGAELLSESFATAAVRFKIPETEKSDEISYNISGVSKNISDDVAFISALVESALIMRDSIYKKDANIDAVISRLKSLNLQDEYKREFLELMEKYKTQM